MASPARAILRSKLPIVTSVLHQNLTRKTPIRRFLLPLIPERLPQDVNSCKPNCDFRQFHDGRPRGPLWRGKKLIGKEALFVILGLKRFKDDEERLDKFIKTHVLRLLKMDMIAVLSELERQEEVFLAVKIFRIIQKQDWYMPDVFLYKDLIMALAKGKKMDQVMELWEMMRKENLFPDSQTFTEVIRGFLRDGSPADAMNVYEEMKKSPDPPEELPFRVLLKGLLPHPLLRNRVKQDYEELFPDRHVLDPPEEIFGVL
ncbi:pentatricopeptide repeat-containing protein [Tripterygium wilfordii]|uniref:Pentatricopeptide repeat-containing protein n=1 Tax=Tripterygium wilfordii TaxID=458696 RepID=A0A7J7D2D6_TRIWF|nr:protein THYLAKOID ASSEMBLY 8-like, chloroplastic [Tripterygium wilfordii]KAF5740483.1 pentatricopeptide repeat-containing protein [Tripterygium wilfordii]